MFTYTRPARAATGALLLALTLALGAGCAAPPPEDGDAGTETSAEAPRGDRAAASPAYRVKPGDSLRIEVFQEPDISRTFNVSDSGTINHPLLGKVKVAGLSLESVETRLHDLLAKDYLVNPKVMVALERSAARPVIVFGEVRTPGAYEIPAGGTMTLLQLVAQAGGFTDIAAIDKVRIVRQQPGGVEETIRVRVSDLLKGNDAEEMTLQPGDVVTVPRTIF